MPVVINGGNDNPQNTNLNVSNEQREEIKTTTSPISPTPPSLPTIANQEVPIVVFVGPPASGKSMVLVRLAKYLRNVGYKIEPDNTLLNTKQYQDGCEEFKDKLSTNVALSGTVKYLLVSIWDRDGNEVAKLLEAPGEHFYDPTNPHSTTVEPYLSTIVASNNPKIYVVMLDLDSPLPFRVGANQVHCSNYSTRWLNQFYSNIEYNRDKVILLYNKIDLTNFGNIHEADEKKARSDAERYYAPMFEHMKRSFLGLFQLDDFDFLTFCTGIFSKTTDDYGNVIYPYNIASDVYPKKLWEKIISRF